jgi:hypothetical protein
MAKTTTILAVVLAIGIGGGAFFVGYLMGNEWMFNTDPTQLTPTIDGIIEKREWLRSTYYNMPFYLDVDNNIDPVVDLANVDGWNYLSVAEDEDYYYVALDLCSDRTNNKNGEWISLHLANRLPDTYWSKLALFALEDFGYEWFFYDVENDEPIGYHMDPNPGLIDYRDVPLFPEADTIEILRGNTTGNWNDFWTYNDGLNFTGTSYYYEALDGWLPGQFLDIQFGVNITEKAPDGIEYLFLPSIDDLDLEFTLKANLTSDPAGHALDPTEFYFGVSEHGPTPVDMSNPGVFMADTNEVPFSGDTIIIGSVDLDHTTINPTNGMLYFTIHCYNEADVVPTGYEIQFDKLSLKIHGGDIASIIGNTTANGNYEIAHGYGASDNCAEAHRMFEFKIAKSEFPTLDDEMLYLNVAGYGTMAIAGTNYWMHPISGWPIPPLYESLYSKSQFLALDMSIT